MGTLIDDNQLLEDYALLGVTYVKAITTTNPDISINNVGGAVTIGYSIPPPPPALFTATMIAGEDAAAFGSIFTGYASSSFTGSSSVGAISPSSSFEYNGYTYYVTVVGSI